MAESQKQLFIGQTNHPLSQEEKDLFWKKIKISGRLFSKDEEAIKSSIEAMMKTPTGREQIRQINADPQKKFKIKIGNQNEMAGTEAMYLLDDNCVHVNPKLFNSNSSTVVGSTIMHELLHNRQPERQSKQLVSKVYMDAEPQALSQQLNLETGNTPDTAYVQSHAKILKKWERIAAGEEKCPQWAQPLQYIEGLTKEEKAEARKMYAQQMTALEVRGDYIEDFVMSQTQKKDGEYSMHIPSFRTNATSIAYNNIDTNDKRNNCEQRTPTDKELSNLKGKYPSLNTSKITRAFTDRKNETEIYYNGNAEMDKLGKAIFNVSPNVPKAQKPLKQLEAVAKLDVDSDLKERAMSELISNYRQNPNATNATLRNMIKTYRKATGKSAKEAPFVRLPSKEERTEATKNAQSGTQQTQSNASARIAQSAQPVSTTNQEQERMPAQQLGGHSQ